MELEELQLAWTKMGRELEEQKKLTNEIIMEMTRTKYRNKFRKTYNYETIGTIMCLGIALYILFHFDTLDTWYLQVCGIITLVFLVVMPLLVLSALKQIKGLDILRATYTQNLINFTKAKTRILRLQQISIGLGFVMVLVVVPVSAKIFNDKDVFLSPLHSGQWMGLTVVLIAMILFSRWGYRSYQKITDSAALLLEDLK